MAISKRYLIGTLFSLNLIEHFFCDDKQMHLEQEKNLSFASNALYTLLRHFYGSHEVFLVVSKHASVFDLKTTSFA